MHSYFTNVKLPFFIIKEIGVIWKIEGKHENKKDIVIFINTKETQIK